MNKERIFDMPLNWQIEIRIDGPIKIKKYTCTKCNWTGTILEMENEYYLERKGELYRISKCPNCTTSHSIVTED